MHNKITTELVRDIHDLVTKKMDKDFSYSDMMNALVCSISDTILNKAINQVNTKEIDLTEMPDFINSQVGFLLQVFRADMKEAWEHYMNTALKDYVVPVEESNVVPFNRSLH